jgi:hypothetical protein
MVSINRSKWAERYGILAILAIIILEPFTYISMYKIGIGEKIGILLMLVLVAWLWNKNKKINLRQFVLFIIMISLLLFNKLVTGDSSKFSAVLCIYIFVSLVFVRSYTTNQFIENYNKAMLLLCVYSLIATYIVVAFSGFFVNVLPQIIHETKGMRFLDTGLCFVYIPLYGMQYRNYSVFQEPGIYQFYIILALIFELWFIKKQPGKKLRLIIYIVALISCFSTTGLLVGMLILIGCFFTREPDNKPYKKMIIGILALTILTYAFVPAIQVLIDDSVAKLGGISGELMTGESAASRVGSAYAYLQAWGEKPFIGWGYTAGTTDLTSLYLSKYTTHNTNTIFSNFAFFGLIYGCLYLGLFSKFIFDIRAPIITKVILFLSMMICINNERFIDSTIIFILLFYSVLGKNGKEKFDEPIRDGKIYRVLR